jgi:hypothetical protein
MGVRPDRGPCARWIARRQVDRSSIDQSLRLERHDATSFVIAMAPMGALHSALTAMGIRDRRRFRLDPPGENGLAERLIGSIRRDS